MTAMTRSLIACAAVLLGACGASHEGTDDAGGGGGADAPPARDAGTTSFAGAYVAWECAPDDGLGLSLLLYTAPVPDCSADADQPSLRFYVFSGSSIVFPIEPGDTIVSDTSSGGFGNGTAQHCPGGAAPCVMSPRWTLTFDTFVEDVSASGTYSVDFEDGTTLTGPFDAEWCMVAPPMCG